MKTRLHKLFTVFAILAAMLAAATVFTNAQTAEKAIYVAGVDVSAGGYWNISGVDSHKRSVLTAASSSDFDIMFEPKLNMLILNNAHLLGTGESAVYFRNFDLKISYKGNCYIGEYCVFSEDGEVAEQGSLDSAIRSENGRLTIDSDRKSTLTLCSGKGGAVVYADNGLIIEKYAKVYVTRNTSSGDENECGIQIGDGENTKIEVYDFAKLTVNSYSAPQSKAKSVHGNTLVYYGAQLSTSETISGNVTVNGGTFEAAEGVNGSVEVLVGQATVKGEISGDVFLHEDTNSSLTLYGYASVKGTINIPQNINTLYGMDETWQGEAVPIKKYTYEEGVKVNFVYEHAFIDVFTAPDKSYRLEPDEFIYAIKGSDLYFYTATDDLGYADYGYTAAIGNRILDYETVSITNASSLDFNRHRYTLKNVTEETDITISVNKIKTTKVTVAGVEIDAQTGDVKNGTLPKGVSYDPETITLTLNNTNIEYHGKSYVIDSDGELTVKVMGNNTITFQGWSGDYNGAISSWNLNITGIGTLNIIGKNGYSSTGLWAGRRGLTIKETTVNISLEAYKYGAEGLRGIWAQNGASVVIDDGANVNIDVGDSKQSTGISYGLNCYINNSVVNVTVGKSDETQYYSGAILLGTTDDENKDVRINGRQCFPEGNIVKITPDDFEFSPSEITVGSNILFQNWGSRYSQDRAVYDTYEYCTIENGVLVPCASTDEWTIHYDFRTNTLYLHNFNYTFDSSAGITADGNLNIVLVDRNALSITTELSYGIVAKGKLNFTGNGSMYINSSNMSTKAVMIYGDSTADKGFVGKISYPQGSKRFGSRWVNSQGAYNASYLTEYVTLYIVGSENTFTNQYKSVTVTFNYGYGSLTETIETYSTGKLKEAMSEPTRSGYTFEGWYYTDDTGEEIQITEATRFSANTKAKAKWAKIKLDYYVTFDPNGGSVSILRIQANSYGYLYSLPVPTREGYTFLGWFSEPYGGEEITTETKFYEDTTVYAQWMHGVFVIFDANDGTTDTEKAFTDNYGKLPQLPVPTRNSYTFLGWFTGIEDGVQVTGDKVFTKETTLYARWKRGVTVTFDPNGGTVDKIYDTTNEYDYLYSLPMPNREGYNFDGWFAEIDGGEIITSETKFKTATTVYARWSKLPDEPTTDEPTTDEPSTGEDPTEPITPPDDTQNDSWFIRFLKAVQNFFTKIITWLQALFGFKIK
ncbi:MAG: InlB B-repeat-containing protein [Clostridia bacterium]|nr:InlB B-repeat-containing protein [Clostridia bacterium]